MPSAIQTLSLARAPAPSFRAWAAAALLALALFFSSSSPAVDTITVKSAELRADEDAYVVSVVFDLAFNPTLEEAVQKGVPLYFVFEFELLRPRWYWVDEKVLSTSTHYRVSYNAITRQYRVAMGLLSQTFDGLDEVERFLSRVTSRQVATLDQLVKGTRYEAAVRMRLDVNALPKPFQIQRARLPRLVDAVGLASLELYALSRILPSRRMRWLLLVLACLGAIALFLLATASANTELFAQQIDLLLVVNGVLGALLVAVVGAQLWRLWEKRRTGVFGYRLAVRLVLVFALVSVLPGALVYAASVMFIGRSIESWFDVRVDRALEGGLNLGRNALDYLKQETVNKATQIALTLAEGGQGPISTRLNRAAEQAGVYEASLFTSTGGVLAVAGIGGSTATPEPPPAAALRRARLQQSTATPEQTADGVFTKLRVVVPVNTDDQLEPLKVLQVIEPVPKALAQDFETLRSGSDDYQKISLSRQGLKRLYALTLTLTLLLALTSALGLAVVLSERISAPLGLLAEGTRAVAQGDFTLRQPVTSTDELGVLTVSFNTMSAQLLEAQQKTEESRRATETTRAYLESILGNLSAGVLAFDDAYRLRTANASAAVILQQPLAELTGVPLDEWGGKLPALAPVAALVADGFRESRDANWQKQAELTVSNLMRTLLMRGSRLPVTPVAGYVVVFDDVTDLAQAQRDAAWGEVARRLAHEIKNPLTPIQLSAERLERKLAPKLDAADQETLARGAQTIIAQVAAMKHMVDDFAIYARRPRPGTMQAVDVGALLLDVLALYDNLRPHVRLSLPPEPLVVQGEPTRLRQVFHNLLQNAIDAQTDVPEPRYEITLNARDSEVALAFCDGGSGFPESVLHRAFEPYVTTKAKGTGLGLAIVKKIVDEHHGRVELANAAPRGAQVTLIFPRSAAAA